MADYDPTFLRRFWAKVQKAPGDGCWLWTRSKAHDYGTVAYRGVVTRVHRLSWELANGPVPDGLFVCHTCDQPKCVRPDHLFIGTQQANMDDMKAKRRGNRNLLRDATHCHRGHEMTEANKLYREIKGKPDAVFMCRACRDQQNTKSRESGRLYAAKLKADLVERRKRAAALTEEEVVAGMRRSGEVWGNGRQMW